MSELHTYRIQWGEPTRGETVRALDAADAVAQFKAAHPWDYLPMSALRVEPIPESLRVRVTIPVAGGNVTQREGTARAATPEDRANGLEDELRRRTAERDDARRNAEATRESRDRIQGQRDQLLAAIFAPGSEPPGIVPVGDLVIVAARIARETREERDRLRRDRDALACAYHVALDTMEEAFKQRDALQKRIDAAKEWLGTRVHLYLGADALLAILEGREP